jgi:hypothetical protein
VIGVTLKAGNGRAIATLTIVRVGVDALAKCRRYAVMRGGRLKLGQPDAMIERHPIGSGRLKLVAESLYALERGRQEPRRPAVPGAQLSWAPEDRQRSGCHTGQVEGAYLLTRQR